MSGSHSLQEEVVDGEDEETESEEEIETINEPIVEYEMVNKQNMIQSLETNIKADKDDKNIMTKDKTENNDNKGNIDDTKQNEEMKDGAVIKKKTSMASILIAKGKGRGKSKAKPQFKEIKARSKFDIVKVGFNRMLKSGKKMVKKNLKQKKRGIWENAIYHTTTVFHEKTMKAISVNLQSFKKQTEKSKGQSQQSVNGLYEATGQITQANKNILAFCDKQQSLIKLY